MKHSLFAGIAAVYLMLAPPPADADTNVLSQAGSWRAFNGTTTNGRPVCGVSADVDNQYFSLKYFAGIPTGVVQMGGKNLQIADDQKQTVTVHIDSYTGWEAEGVGMKFNDGDPGLEFKINRRQLDRFVEELQAGHSLTVSMPRSSNSDWNFDLTGTRAVHAAIAGCIRKLPSSWSK